MKLRYKLVVAQAPLYGALLLMGALSLYTVAQLGGQSQVIIKDNYRSVLAAERMKEAIERLDSAAVFLVAGRADKALPQAAKNLPRFEEELRAEELNLTEPDEPETARRLRTLWTKYQQEFATLRTLRQEPMRTYYFDVLQPSFEAVKGVADEVLSINQDAMVRKSDRAGKLAQKISTLLILATLLLGVLGVFLSVSWTNRLLRPLGVLGQAVRRLGEGDLEARAVLSGDDEVGHLAGEFNTMARRLREYRKSSLGELLQAQHASQATIDSLPDPVIVFGIQGEVLSVNRAAETLLGLSLEAGPDPLSQVAPPMRELLLRVCGHVLSGKGPYVPRGFEEALRISPASAGDGERYLLPRATPVYAEEGGIAGAAVLLQDVTRLRRFDELKNDMVATVAHEFRTPLTSLRMAIHLCIEQSAGPLTEQQADLLHAAREDCERLQSIVDELLDLARIQGGRFELSPRRTPVNTLVQQALDAHKSVAEENRVRLRQSVLPGVPDVFVDRDRVQLVLSNLLANAIRHARGGEVEVRAFAVPAPDAALGKVRFEVADTGEGIPSEYHHLVFDRFFRVPGAPAGGAGLGLPIVKEIVTAHGGEVGLRSEPGQGSTFWFTLPVAQKESEGGPAA